MTDRVIDIAGRKIGQGHPAFIVAEMSANHQQSFERAVEILRAAKDCGADAIKLQTYTPDTITIDCRNEYFQIGKGTIWEGRYLYDLYGEAYTPGSGNPSSKNWPKTWDWGSSPPHSTTLQLNF